MNIKYELYENQAASVSSSVVEAVGSLQNWKLKAVIMQRISRLKRKI